MISADLNWKFIPGFDSTRQALLESVSDFGKVIDRIVAESTLIRFQVCRGKDGCLKNSFRPEFVLAVNEKTADMFFNSPAGYRAQYLLDPDEGQKQNNKLLHAISDKLISFAAESTSKHKMMESQVKASLLACSAKVWLPEDSFKFNHELVEEILVPLWHSNALAALAAFNNRQRPSPEEQEKAIWGIRAPRCTALEVKGCFIDPEGNEVVPVVKIGRRFEIHSYGYA